MATKKYANRLQKEKNDTQQEDSEMRKRSVHTSQNESRLWNISFHIAICVKTIEIFTTLYKFICCTKKTIWDAVLEILWTQILNNIIFNKNIFELNDDIKWLRYIFDYIKFSTYY